MEEQRANKQTNSAPLGQERCGPVEYTMIDQQTAMERSNVLTTSSEESCELAGQTPTTASKKLPSRKKRLLQAKSCPSFTPQNVPAKSPSVGVISSSQSHSTASTSHNSASVLVDVKADDNQSSSSKSSDIKQQQQHRLVRRNVSILGSIISLFEHDEKHKREPSERRLHGNNKAESAGGDLEGKCTATVPTSVSKVDEPVVVVVHVVQNEEEGEGSQNEKLQQPRRQQSVSREGGSNVIRRHSSFLSSKSYCFPIENDNDDVASPSSPSVEVTIQPQEANPTELVESHSHVVKKHGEDNDDDDEDEISNVTEDADSTLFDNDSKCDDGFGDKNETPYNLISGDTASAARVVSGQLLQDGHHRSQQQHRRRHSANSLDDIGCINATPRHHRRNLSTSSSSQIPVAPPPPPFLPVEQQQEWSLLDCAKAAGAIYWSLLCAPDAGHQEKNM